MILLDTYSGVLQYSDKGAVQTGRVFIHGGGSNLKLHLRTFRKSISCGWYLKQYVIQFNFPLLGQWIKIGPLSIFYFNKIKMSMTQYRLNVVTHLKQPQKIILLKRTLKSFFPKFTGIVAILKNIMRWVIYNQITFFGIWTFWKKDEFFILKMCFNFV